MNKTGNEGGSVTIPLPDQGGFAGMAWWNNLTNVNGLIGRSSPRLVRASDAWELYKAYAAVVEGMVIDPATQPFAEFYCVGPRLAFQCVP